MARILATRNPRSAIERCHFILDQPLYHVRALLFGTDRVMGDRWRRPVWRCTRCFAQKHSTLTIASCAAKGNQREVLSSEGETNAWLSSRKRGVRGSALPRKDVYNDLAIPYQRVGEFETFRSEPMASENGVIELMTEASPTRELFGDLRWCRFSAPCPDYKLRCGTVGE